MIVLSRPSARVYVNRKGALSNGEEEEEEEEWTVRRRSPLEVVVVGEFPVFLRFRTRHPCSAKVWLIGVLSRSPGNFFAL